MTNSNQEPELSLGLIKQQLEHLCYKDGKTIRSYRLIFKLYYYLRLLKYATQSQLQAINIKGIGKVATKPILNEFVRLGHISLADKSGRIYIPNEMTNKIVKAVKFNERNFFKVFPNLPKGTEADNEIKNTEVFIHALQMKYYYFLLFCDFGYVRPDGLLVQRDGNKYKLSFLEIETKQSNWQERLNRMRDNYLKLSNDIAVYEYWKNIAQNINLPVPDIKDFKFSVIIVGDISEKWEDGFEFTQSLL